MTQPKIPRCDDCEPRTGGATGDPHLTTFDGVYFDAQVRGEYIFARTTAAAAAAGNDVEIRGRTEPSLATARVYPVTSVTAASVRVGDHRVEVYARAADGLGFTSPRCTSTAC